MNLRVSGGDTGGVERRGGNDINTIFLYEISIKQKVNCLTLIDKDFSQLW